MTNLGGSFSKNVSDDVRVELSSILGVTRPLNLGRYLGLPSLIGRDNKSIFCYVRDKLWNRLQGWRNKKVFKVGKDVLIKSAAQAIPVFCIASILLSSTLANEL
ncbi:hypothetical protein ACS0TY_007248 [Phlomoides rotata]